MTPEFCDEFYPEPTRSQKLKPVCKRARELLFRVQQRLLVAKKTMITDFSATPEPKQHAS